MDHHFPYIKKQKQKRKKNLSEILRIGEGVVSLMFWHFWQQASTKLNGCKIITSEILVAEIRHFVTNESPKQHGQANFLEKS